MRVSWNKRQGSQSVILLLLLLLLLLLPFVFIVQPPVTDTNMCARVCEWARIFASCARPFPRARTCMTYAAGILIM